MRWRSPSARSTRAAIQGPSPLRCWPPFTGHLVPNGLLAEAEVGSLARAGEAARAFAAVTITPPDSLVAVIAADAGALVARARVGVANGAVLESARADVSNH